MLPPALKWNSPEVLISVRVVIVAELLNCVFVPDVTFNVSQITDFSKVVFLALRILIEGCKVVFPIIPLKEASVVAGILIVKVWSPVIVEASVEKLMAVPVARAVFLSSRSSVRVTAPL